MTSPARTPDSSRESGRDQGTNRRREAVEKAKTRIRTATGRDGNGLKDAARRVSETVKAGMSKAKEGATQERRPAGGDARPAPGREMASRASDLVRGKVEQVKQATGSYAQSANR